MADLINTRYKGVNITLAITGLPITITGEVLSPNGTGVVSLKLKEGKIVNIAESLIAFFF